jgi:hypothetical protein
LEPLEPPERLHRIFDLSNQFVVEVETHPQQPTEHAFLTGDGIRNALGSREVSRRYDVGPGKIAQE